MLGALVLFGVLAIAPYIPREVIPTSATANVFSAERAMAHLQVIASEPHPVGSPANARVRDYLVAQLSALGLQPSVQHAGVFRGPTGDGVVVDNVLVRLSGTGSTGAVLVTAHYDSTVNAPAAGDDGMAVAAMVEALRALRAGPPLSNDVIFLFNDGEEPGMYGSQAFIQQHPWARDVRVVFDFDADSPTGPSTVLWATPGDGWLLGEVARAGSGVLVGPMENRSWRQEFHHDLHVFAAAGYTGLHFDRVGGSTMYHTERDSLANVEMPALQQQGAVILALTQHLGDIPLDATKTDDATVVSTFGLSLFWYPLSWALPLALAVGLCLVLLVSLGLWRHRLTARTLAGVALVLVGGAGLLALLAQLAWEAMVAAHPEAVFFSERAFYGQPWFLGGVYVLTSAAMLAVLPWLVRRLGVLHLLATGIASGVVLAIVFAATEPDLTYQATWPALIGVLTLAYLLYTDARSVGTPLGWLQFAVLLIAAVPTVGFLVGALFEPVIGGLSEGPALVVPALIMLAALLAPQLAVVTQAGGRWLASAVALIGVGLLAVGMANSGFSPTQPRPSVLAYGLDADTGMAYWVTLDTPLDGWTGQFLNGGSGRTLDELLGASEPLPVLAAQAPAVTLPPPSLTLNAQEEAADGVRTLWLHLVSPRQAGRLHLYGGPGTQILAANIGDALPVPIEGNEVLISGLPVDGLDVEVEVRTTGPARFTLLDRSTGLPNLPGLPPRPATVMSAPVGEDLSAYPTLVRASYTVPPPD